MKDSLEKRMYIGNCITLSHDPNFHRYFENISQMAKVVDEGEEISWEDFIKAVGCRLFPKRLKKSGKGFTFWREDLDTGLYWAYDIKRDIHYFYANW